MPPSPTVSPPNASRGRWPWGLLWFGLGFLAVVAALWIGQRMMALPGTLVDKTTALVKEIGHQAATVGRAFREQTIRQEFLSSSVKVTGTSRLQVATHQAHETFRRAERDSVAWGWISLPEVVVQADVPVEYTYYLDFNGPWEFEQKDDLVTVHAPPIQPNTPAPDVSQLKFYTLEGHLWQDDKAVRERLQGSLTAALRARAVEHLPLVRDTARREVETFVTKWMADSFSDGRAFRVKVIFPEEIPAKVEGGAKPTIKQTE